MASKENDYPMKRLPSNAAILVQPNAEPKSEQKYSQDEADLARYGKKQQLKRHFGLISIIGLTCTLMVTWEGFIATFQEGLANGGPAGLVYGFLFTWIGSGCQILVMAEMASMIPLAGGQYNWVAVLSPPAYSKFLSYLTGWITVISWQAALASSAFLGGTLIQGLLVLNYPGYDSHRWHGTLFYYAIVCIGLFINTYLARLLPKIEAAVLALHVIGFFCILVPLVYLGPHGSAQSVFTVFANTGGWSSGGLSFFVGLPTSMFAFVGSDAASHIAEEITQASTVIPKSMIASVAVNGILGFAMMIAILFCLGNEQDALNSPTQYPIIEVFANATGSYKGADAMTSVIIAAQIFATVGYLATASRMLWAFAREKAVPFSSILAKVEPRTALPLYSIALTTSISLALALINIGSTTAFRAFTSLVVSSFYTIFAIAAVVLLQKRLTTPAGKILYGPFKLGRAGIPIILASLAYSVIGIFFSFWPATPVVTASSMNWSIVVYGGTVVLSLLFWVLHGRKVYTGPIVEIEVLDHQ